MAVYLTTREVQDLLKVDRSTVYRMAEDGRLPGVKVGRQWRFPADRIDAMLGVTPTVARPAPVAGAAPVASTPPGPPMPGTGLRGDLGDLLPLEAIEAMAELLGDLMGAMVVVTDMEGRPLTRVANPCGLYTAFEDDPEVLAKCIEGWRDYADDLDLEPRFRPSHFGFLCARGFIRVGAELRGMVIVGGFAADQWPPVPEHVREIVADLGVAEAEYRRHVDEVFHADEAHLQMIRSLLPRISILVSHMATARDELVSKLVAIAELAHAHTPTRSTP